MNVSIRAASVNDIPWLCSQLREFAQFVGTGRSLFPSPAKCIAVLSSLISEHPMFIAEKEVPLDDRIGEFHRVCVGFIGGTLTPHPMNDEIQLLTELFWWVEPKYRNGRAGLLLLQAFHAYGRAHADMIVMTLEAHSPVNPATLERRGFKLVEHTYLLEV